MDVISHFEDISSSGVEGNEHTPAGKALAKVLSEVDEIAKATMNSITLATMLRMIERERALPAHDTPHGQPAATR